MPLPDVPAKENPMTRTLRLTDRPNPSPTSLPAEDRQWQRAVHLHRDKATVNPSRRRFDKITIACLLGGIVLGTVGGILGACMPYRHPVAVGMSVLWWSIYCGCFGVSLGAWCSCFTERPPNSPSPETAGAGKPPIEEDRPALPVGNSGSFHGPNPVGMGVSRSASSKTLLS
jgi:hypothetical protein